MPRRLIVVALSAALSACVAQSGGPDKSDGPDKSGGPDTPETPVDDQSMSEPQQPNMVATPTPPPQQAAIDPASLVGMTGERVTALFGTPVFVRRDPPGEFWRYRGQTCVLELFFYLQGGAQRVDHLETRNTGSKPEDRANCIAKLRKPPAEG